MRTTGVRCAPTPVPRTVLGPGGSPPQPLPRTKFPSDVIESPVNSPRERLPQELPNKHSSVKNDVISDHLSLRSRLSRKDKEDILKDLRTSEVQSSTSTTPPAKSESSGSTPEGSASHTAVVTPPPKPPRTFLYLPSPAQQKKQSGGSPQHSWMQDPQLPTGYKPTDVKTENAHRKSNRTSVVKASCSKIENALRKSSHFPGQPVGPNSENALRKSSQTPVQPIGPNSENALRKSSHFPGHPVGPKSENALRKSNLTLVVEASSPKLTGDINSSSIPREQRRPTLTASPEEERCTPCQGATSPSSDTAQESAILSPSQTVTPRERQSTNCSSVGRPNVASRRPLHRRFPTFPLPSVTTPPPLPTSPPPPLPTAPPPSVRPAIPSRPKGGIFRSQRGAPRGAASNAFPRPPLVFLRSASSSSVRTFDQDSVCTPTDFDDNCKRVFRHTRVAEEHMAKGKHIQAASEYQAALTAIDRVLRTQVLAITKDEATRQRFFHQQQEVFYTRKEALNGFSDAQAAITTPRGLGPSNQPRGAPPSYDDVIREDLSRSQDLLVSPCSEEETLPTEVMGQPSGQRSTHRPQRTPRTRSSSACEREPTGLVLVDVSGEAGIEPVPLSTGPQRTVPVNLGSQQLVPSRALLPRPKSSYHPRQEVASQPTADGSALLPTPNHPEETRGPKPRSTSGRSEAQSLETRDSNDPNEASVPESRSSPEADEALVHQALALQKFKERRKKERLASESRSTKRMGMAKALEAFPPKPNSTGGSATNGFQVLHSQGGKDKVPSKMPATSATVIGSSVSQTTTVSSAPSRSSIIDPFTTVDPFPPVDPSEVNADALFPEGNQTSSTPVTRKAHLNTKSESNTKPGNKRDPLQTPIKPSVTGGSPAEDDAVGQAGQASTGSPTGENGTGENLGDSILDALDFATVSRTPSQRRASFQRSKGSMSLRCYSEETLLDYSYRTLENYLHSNAAVGASRASIIEEFDPLASPSSEEETTEEASSVGGMSQSRDAKTVESKLDDERSERRTETGNEEPKDVSATRVYGEEEGATMMAAQDVHEDVAGRDFCDSDGIRSLPLIDDLGARSFFSSKSCLSWPPDHTSNAAPCSLPAVAPCSADAAATAAGGNPWTASSPDHETSVSLSSLDVGRSAFYAPLSQQQEQGGSSSSRSGRTASHGYYTFRDLLRIREGVKIFFIYEDGVVTSPWNRPILAVSKDPDKAGLVGEGVVLRAGTDLWSCQLHRKSTLVLRMVSGIYIFGDVAGRPECKAVGVRVPSCVRQAQHELLGQILRENTLMEDERPTGITKAISKSASSAATKVNQLVEEKSMSPNTAFIRKNSIRALKGMSRRLNTIAERTGSNMKELPAEYNKLQEAANSLRFSRSAKMVQYV